MKPLTVEEQKVIRFAGEEGYLTEDMVGELLSNPELAQMYLAEVERLSEER